MTQAHGEQPTQLNEISHQTGIFAGLTSRQIVGPLWFVFAGGAICCLTLGLTANLHGADNWSLRPTDHPLGAILILIGVWKLGRVDVGPDYRWLMRFTLAVALVQTAASIADFFPPPTDPAFAAIRLLIGLASIAAAIGFCICMRWFCQDTRLWRSAKGWHHATVVLCCCTLPIVILQCLMFNAALTIAHIGASSSTQPSWPWAWWYLLIIPFIVAPPIAFLSSILQMGRELERAEAYERETLVLLSPPPPGSGA